MYTYIYIAFSKGPALRNAGAGKAGVARMICCKGSAAPYVAPRVAQFASPSQSENEQQVPSILGQIEYLRLWVEQYVHCHCRISCISACSGYASCSSKEVDGAVLVLELEVVQRDRQNDAGDERLPRASPSWGGLLKKHGGCLFKGNLL